MVSCLIKSLILLPSQHHVSSIFLGRFSIKNAIGHFDLFFDIVEAHLPGTYSSSEDASTAVKIYLHRRRENQAKQLKLTNQNRFNDEENQENE